MNTKFSNYLLYAFAVIGFISVLSSFNSQTEQTNCGTPESHVWEMYLLDTGERHYKYQLNKKTGEVRQFGKDGKYVLSQEVDKI
jgi:hypothetical protein